jgi:hypothetical protein
VAVLLVPGVKHDQWDLSGPEFRAGLGFNPDGARWPFPPSYRAPQKRRGDALKRIARYSQITNEALVVGYREGNRLLINLSYSGVPRYSDRHQIERADGAEPRTATLLDCSRDPPPKWRDLSERKWSSALIETSLP